MHQGIQGKEVTFKDVLILFFKRFERIFIVALAFAVVFAAYGAMRGYRAISSENRQKQLDDYQIKLDEYNDSTQKLRDTIDDSQKQLQYAPIRARSMPRYCNCCVAISTMSAGDSHSAFNVCHII